MIRCPFCNAVYTEDEAACPICGKEKPQPSPAARQTQENRSVTEAPQPQTLAEEPAHTFQPAGEWASPQDADADGWFTQQDLYGPPPEDGRSPQRDAPSAPQGESVLIYRMELNTVQTLGILSVCLSLSTVVTGLVLGILGLIRANRLRGQVRHPLAMEEVRRARSLNLIGVVIGAVRVAILFLYIIFFFLFSFRFGIRNMMPDAFLTLLCGF